MSMILNMGLVVWILGFRVSRSDIRDLLLQCRADEAPDVRQSALALVKV